MNALKSITLALVLSACLSPTASLGQAATVSKAAKELVEQFSKAGAKNSVKELAEIGGEKAVREVIEKAARQGGDELVQQVVAIARKAGPRSIKVLEVDPALMTKALRSVPEGKMTSVIAESARNPQLTAKLVRSHGDEVLLASARHPGVGAGIIDEFGEAGLIAAKKLETGDVIVLAKTKGFRELPSSAKQQFLDLLRENPQKVASTLVTLAAGGTAIVLTADLVDHLTDTIVGTADAPGPAIKPIITTTWMIGGVVTAALLLYLGIKLWGVAQREKRKAREE